MEHPELRRVLGAPESAEAREEHHARGAQRRRLVRRRRFLRSARDLSRRRALDADEQEPDRDRPVAARRLGVDAGRCARRHPLRIDDRRALPQRDRAAVLQAPPEGQGRARRPRKPRCSRPAATRGRRSTPGRRATTDATTLYFQADGRLSFTPPAAAPRGGGVRRVRLRSGEARAVEHGDADDAGTSVDDRGPALRGRAAGRARLSHRAARPRTS